MDTGPSTTPRPPCAGRRVHPPSRRCPDATSSLRRSWRGRAALFLQFDDRDAAAALVVRRGAERRHEWMHAQEFRDRPAELPGPVAVDDAQVLQIVDRRLVEESLDPPDRLF